MRKIAMTFSFLIALYFLIAGRGRTLHMTEGEAFLAAWDCWALVVIWVLVGCSYARPIRRKTCGK